MVGRSDVVLEIQGLLQAGQRLITVLGLQYRKTTVAAVSRNGAWRTSLGAAFFVDLSTVNDQGASDRRRSFPRSGSGRSGPIQSEALLNFLALAVAYHSSIVARASHREIAEFAGSIFQNAPEL